MIKEILESIDKLQTDLNEANATKLPFEKWAKNVDDQVAIFQQ